MATKVWNTGYGVWNVGTNWAGGVAPGGGDTALINSATAEPDLSGMPISNVTIDYQDAFKLDLGTTQLMVDTRVIFNNAGTATLAAFGTVTNYGTMATGSGTGEVDIYLVGGVGAAFENPGVMDLSAPLRILGGSGFTNANLLRLHAAGSTPSLTAFGSIANFGTIALDGATASLGGVTGTGTITLSFATLAMTGEVGAGQTVAFLNSHGAMALDLASHGFGGVIAGFRPGDSIDLGLPSVDSVTFTPGSPGNPGTLTLFQVNVPLATLLLQGDYQSADFAVALNGQGHEVLTTAAAPCFATGSRLLTAAGEVAVEALRVGDRLPTRSGRLAAIVWIGHRTLDCRRHARPQDVLPVRVTQDAFGPGAPHRDLLLSPDHAVHLEPGILVPVRYLVNGATIRQEPAGRITYWHVELDRHDVVMAEGLAVETYLDTGNRGAFANGGGAAQLHPDFARGMWEAAGCAPLVVAGPALAAARAALLDRAEALGHGSSPDAAPCLLVDGRPVAGRAAGGGLEFDLPAGARRALLRSRTACPAQIAPEAADHRRLGVAVAAVALDGTALALDDARLDAGWHAPEPGLRWTGGAAAIDVRGGRVLALRLLPLLRYRVTAPRGGRSASAAP